MGYAPRKKDRDVSESSTRGSRFHWFETTHTASSSGDAQMPITSQNTHTVDKQRHEKQKQKCFK
jgi:hypothetical protein